MCGISYGCGYSSPTCSPVMRTEEHVIPIVVPNRPRSIPVRKNKFSNLREEFNYNTLISVNIEKCDDVIYYLSFIDGIGNRISYFDLLDTTKSIKEEDLAGLFKEYGKEIKITHNTIDQFCLKRSNYG
jgi:hypothetical protein